ncbi:MAG: sulfotransferase, partial [Calditrichota bacterium]
MTFLEEPEQIFQLQEKTFLCFDEPFRPHLRQHVESQDDDKKHTMGEYLKRPDLINRYWSTILPYEEYYPELVQHRVEYIRKLVQDNANVCIDFVRCHAKIEHIRQEFPDAFIIHLVRDPRAFVTSHLKPYGQWIHDSLPTDFFKYHGWFDYWQYQTLARALNFKGTAVEQLLQLWGYFTRVAEAQHPDLTVQFEEFAL